MKRRLKRLRAKQIARGRALRRAAAQAQRAATAARPAEPPPAPAPLRKRRSAAKQGRAAP